MYAQERKWFWTCFVAGAWSQRVCWQVFDETPTCDWLAHLAAFLRRHIHSPEARGGLDAILFNGGVFQPAALRRRLVDVLRPWYPAGWEPLVLSTPSLDLAVAWGAASYA